MWGGWISTHTLCACDFSWLWSMCVVIHLLKHCPYVQETTGPASPPLPQQAMLLVHAEESQRAQRAQQQLELEQQQQRALHAQQKQRREFEEGQQWLERAREQHLSGQQAGSQQVYQRISEHPEQAHRVVGQVPAHGAILPLSQQAQQADGVPAESLPLAAALRAMSHPHIRQEASNHASFYFSPSALEETAGDPPGVHVYVDNRNKKFNKKKK